jgi:hypothetical protein
MLRLALMVSDIDQCVPRRTLRTDSWLCTTILKNSCKRRTTLSVVATVVSGDVKSRISSALTACIPLAAVSYTGLITWTTFASIQNPITERLDTSLVLASPSRIERMDPIRVVYGVCVTYSVPNKDCLIS